MFNSGNSSVCGNIYLGTFDVAVLIKVQLAVESLDGEPW